MARKPRSDSKVKNLSDEVQEELWEFCESATNYSVEAVEWLRHNYSVRTSKSAVGEWYSWYGRRLRIRRSEDTMLQSLQTLKELDPNLTAEDMMQLGNMLFMSESLNAGDAKQFASIAYVQLKKKELDLDREKLEEMKRKARVAEGVEDVVKERLSDKEAMKKVKALLGIPE